MDSQGKEILVKALHPSQYEEIDGINNETLPEGCFCLDEVNMNSVDTTNVPMELDLLESGDNNGTSRKKTLLLDLNTANYQDNPAPTSPDSEDVLGFINYMSEASVDGDPNHERSHCFSKIFRPKPFNELMPEVYVPNESIRLAVTEIRPIQSHFTVHYMVKILLWHGDHSWTVTRKLKQIHELHKQLWLFKTKLKLPAATKSGRERRNTLRQRMQTVIPVGRNHADKEKNNERILKYPKRALQNMDNNAMKELEIYLQNLLRHPLFKSHKNTLEFFEVSPLSFLAYMGEKGREGYAYKRSGGYTVAGVCGCCGQCTSRISCQWLVLRETCLFFVRRHTGDVRSVMLLDKQFQVSHGFRHTGVRHGLLITNLSRKLTVQLNDDSSEREWHEAIQTMQRRYGHDFTHADNSHGSFAPVRKEVYARWYVDGARYMHDVADMLELAKEEIYITDWWLSPEIYLKRPDLTGKRWRLAEVLRRQAEKGVHVFVLLYKEVEMALGINSLYSKQTLSSLHPNIKVLRHPDHYGGGVLYWAHHEKLVIIDQMYAFVSGIDLAFGRWDNYKHRLTDVGHGGKVERTNSGLQSTSTISQLIRGTHGIIASSVSNLVPLNHLKMVTKNSGEQSVPTNAKIRNRSSSLGSLTNISKEICKNRKRRLSAKEYRDVSFKLRTGGGSRDTSSEDGDDEASLGEETPALPDEDECDTIRTVGTVLPEDRHQKNDTSQNSTRVIGINSDIARSSAPYDSLPRNASKIAFLKNQRTLSDKSDSDRREYVAKKVRRMKEYMEEKGRGVKAWTEKNMPTLQRSASVGSEINHLSSSDEDKSEVPNRITRLMQLKKYKGLYRKKSSSLSSLAYAHSSAVVEENTSVHTWVGKDYVNWITKDVDHLQEPFKDIVDRNKTPRMPWHDIGLYVEGAAARDAARHFIQRWNAIKREKVNANPHYPYLLPKTYREESFQPSTLVPKHKVNCQVVRSAGQWSAGLCDTEDSIYQAYLSTIRNAKHYIYIENQFFITSSQPGFSTEVLNGIGYEITHRIIQAHRKQEVFRVYILVPLLPAFEGEIGTSSGTSMQCIIHYNYKSIIRSKNSVIQTLEQAGIHDWSRYLSFCSLRTHETLQEQLITELIYIHSKLLIVDDCVVIAGSANINDRSLLGERDSEVALVIQDCEFEDSIMNGEPYQSGMFAGGLRRYLFSEHLGLVGADNLDSIIDPISDRFFLHTWNSVASQNTQIYEEVFSCFPTNCATTFADVDRLLKSGNLSDSCPEEAKKKLVKVQGHLVQFPLDFLKEENLKPPPMTKEQLLPAEVWT